VTYQWYLEGGPILGATNFTYGILSAGSGDAGSYKVVVSNSAGSITNGPTTLKVQYPFEDVFAPVIGTGGVEVGFKGTLGLTYTIERAPTVNGPWTTIGTALIGAEGSALIMDPSPPPGSAFYRTVIP
jgi:hypothetical protein